MLFMISMVEYLSFLSIRIFGNNSSMGLDPFGDRYLGNDQKTVYRGIYSLID